MTTVAPAARGERIAGALRAIAVVTPCLIIAGLVVARLDTSVADRGLVTAPFLWAAVVWAAVLLLLAARFERIEDAGLERNPPVIAAAIAVIVTGVGSANSGDDGTSVSFLLGHALGTFVFWWGVVCLVVCLVREPVSGD